MATSGIMQIGEVAKRASLTVEFRLYTEDALERLRFIQQMQALGLSLKEVGELLKLRERKVDA